MDGDDPRVPGHLTRPAAAAPRPGVSSSTKTGLCSTPLAGDFCATTSVPALEAYRCVVSVLRAEPGASGCVERAAPFTGWLRVGHGDVTTARGPTGSLRS